MEKRRLIRRALLAASAFLFMFTAASPAHGSVQSSANYTISRYITSGGGGNATSTSYALSSATGQPSPPGTASSTGYTVKGGFWNTVFLLVLREDVIIDFGAPYGIWGRYNDATWKKVHGLNPEIVVLGDMDGGGQKDIVVDFGSPYGIWVRRNDAGWAKLHGLSPDTLVCGEVDGS